MIALLFSIISAAAAEVGGIIALKSKKSLHNLLGFTAGALLGIVAFDIFPEIHELSNEHGIDINVPMIAFVIGFLLFHIIEKFILIHHSHENSYTVHTHPHVGVLGATALIGHSFLDGISIGVAFQVNNSVGIAVAIAIIAHRFVDGFNGVTIMLRHKSKRSLTKAVLVVVSVAPILGALLSSVISLSTVFLVTYLGFFAGFLVYISASDILPQAHSKHSSRTTIVLTVAGATAMYALISLID